MSSVVSENSLLIEFLTEELPPFNLEKNIGEAFALGVYSQLSGFINPDSQLQVIVTPRRFGCLIRGINLESAPLRSLRKGPALLSAFRDGQPTPALLGFAKSCACAWESLVPRDDGYFYFEVVQPGQSLASCLNEIIASALKKIVAPKAMRWGVSAYSFIRPVHNLMVLINDQIIPCQAFGFSATATTSGHRFMSSAPIIISHAASYFTQMLTQGKVVAQFSERRELIMQQLAAKAQQLDLRLSPVAGLVDEVCGLVEWPEVLAGSFAPKFLAVPQECLILSMAKNQKYFALIDAAGKLSHHFLFVANLISHDPQVVIAGNQKVLAARLADAEFFYEFDQRTPLSAFIPKMASVVYHPKLGSLLERSQRLQQIAAALAPALGVTPELAQHSAGLLKADLQSEMVGEFPELQGIMGHYYALHSGETAAVALAIEQHYYPRFSGDELPASDLATIMALSDKLESLVGIWGLGLIPSGDKDPYALRRAALGVVRILLSTNLDLKVLLSAAAQAFHDLPSTTLPEVYQFILQRLANYLCSDYPTKVVNALLATLDYHQDGALKFNYLSGLLQTLVSFAADPVNQSLLQANKRLENILKKNVLPLTTSVAPELLLENAEQELFAVFSTTFAEGKKLRQLHEQQDWSGYFTALASFNQPLDNFFATVMVNCDDLSLRHNRLNLLNVLHAHFNLVCQLSELA